MWGRLKALIRKELLAVLRDPRGRMILIGPPILQLFIFSFAATLDVSDADIAVLNRDAGRWSVEMIRRVQGSSVFRRIKMLRGAQEIRPVIDGRDALAVIHFGPDFSADIEAGRPAQLQVILDGRRSNASQIVLGYLQEIANGLAAGIRFTGRPAAPDPVAVRNWFNPNLDYVWFTVPSLIGVITLLVALTVTGLSVARERELGTFDQLMVSPLRTHEILLGKTVPSLLVGLFHSTVYLLAAVFIFGIPFRGSLVLLYLSIVLYLASVIGVGLFISSIAQTQQQAFLGAFLFAAPAVLLSGFATPVESMPDWLQTGTLINPLRHFLVIVKGIFLKGMPPQDVLMHALPLLPIAAVTLTTAAWLFRRRME